MVIGVFILYLIFNISGQLSDFAATLAMGISLGGVTSNIQSSYQLLSKMSGIGLSLAKKSGAMDAISKRLQNNNMNKKAGSIGEIKDGDLIGDKDKTTAKESSKGDMANKKAGSIDEIKDRDLIEDKDKTTDKDS
jgi:hypothetical protein